MRTLVLLAMILVVVGALNWGLIGFFNYDLINGVLGGQSVYAPRPLARIVYMLTGLAALLLLMRLGEIRRELR